MGAAAGEASAVGAAVGPATGRADASACLAWRMAHLARIRKQLRPPPEKRCVRIREAAPLRSRRRSTPTRGKWSGGQARLLLVIGRLQVLEVLQS